MVGMGLLASNAYREWRHGRQKHLDVQIQGGPDLHQQMFDHFAEWIEERGLQPVDVTYTVGSRHGAKQLQVFEHLDERLERLYGTRYALPEAREKVEKKLAKTPDLVVVVSVSRDEFPCSECEKTLGKGSWLIMEDQGPLCLECADLDHLEYLPRGNATLTRRAKKYSALAAVVVKFSRARRRYERQGILVTEGAINRAEEECLQDAEERARRRELRQARVAQEDEEYLGTVTQLILEHYPKCPPQEAQAIAQHTTRRGSGRVGRSAAARELDFDFIDLAIVAHIRHEHTEYDELLMTGTPRPEARDMVRDKIADVRESWEG